MQCIRPEDRAVPPRVRRPPMICRCAFVLSLVGFVVVHGIDFQPVHAQATAEAPRALRRDGPITNAIRAALEAGTRDRSGRPGPNYWQLQTDYLITVRLDPATQTLTGT